MTGDRPAGNDRAFENWQARRIQELAGDPRLRAEIERDLQRMSEGLPPSGTRVTFEELRLLARPRNT